MPRMRRRPLGKTGLTVSELALGTWGLSGDGYGPVSELEQDRVIERARALGITLFETADTYAQGEMEKRLGRLLGSDPQILFATKVGTDCTSVPSAKCFEPEYLRQAIEQSRERLGRERIDILLLHNPSLKTLQKQEATGLLKELKQIHALRAWGVSAGSLEVAEAALKQGADVISCAYNVFYRKPLRSLEAELKTTGAGLLVHSVLAYGLLCGHWSSEKEFAPGDHRGERWTGDELRRRIRHLDALRPVVGGEVPTLRSGALRFALQHERVNAAILGPRNAIQLDQLVREAGKSPPYLQPEKLQALERRLQALGVER